MVEIEGDFTTTEAEDYTEVNVTSNLQIFIDDNETYQNVLFRTNGNEVQFQCRSRDWTIRNIGFDGPKPDRTPAHFHAAAVGGTTGTVENIYAGDGGRGDWRDKHQRGLTQDQPQFMFTHSDNSGDIYVRNVYAGPFVDNTFYCENQSRNDGNMHFENVVCEGGAVTQFRVGPGNHTLDNCMSIDAGQGIDNNHGGCRDLWHRANNPQTTATDCHFEGDGSGILAPSGRVDLVNSQYGGGSGNINLDSDSGTNPQAYFPESVPTSPEEAASGGTVSDPDEPPEDPDEPEEPSPYGPYEKTTSIPANSETTVEFSVPLSEIGEDDINWLVKSDGNWDTGLYQQGSNTSPYSHTLEPTETATGTFHWEPTAIGEYIVTVFSEDDSANEQVEVVNDVTPTFPTSGVQGYVSMDFGDGEVHEVPVYKPEDVQYPCVRFDPGVGTTLAFDIKPRSDAEYPAFGIETAGGTYSLNALDLPDDGDDGDDDEPDNPDEPDEPDESTIIERFEHNNLDRYFDRYTNQYDITTNWSQEGNRSLRLRTGQHVGGEIVSTGEQDYLPVRGDDIEYYFTFSKDTDRINDTAQHRFRFGYQDGDAIDIAYDPRVQTAQISEWIDYQQFQILEMADTSFTVGGAVIRADVRWREDGFTAQFFDANTQNTLTPQLHATPDNYNPDKGQIAISHVAYDNDLEIYSDNYHVK